MGLEISAGTIELADRVVYLSDGRVVATGTHGELLAEPNYRSLVLAYEVARQYMLRLEPADLRDPDMLERLARQARTDTSTFRARFGPAVGLEE